MVRRGADDNMPFHRLYYHIVWTTSGRERMIVLEIEKAVHKAIRDKAESLHAKVFAIGGVEDHVHAAITVPPTLALADFIGGLKGASAYHINHVPNSSHRLEWQRGYGVLSFSHDHLDRVVRYIKNQKEHHAAGKLLASLEECSDDDGSKPSMVRETRAEYDPFA